MKAPDDYTPIEPDGPVLGGRNYDRELSPEELAAVERELREEFGMEPPTTPPLDAGTRRARQPAGSVS